MIKSFIFDLGDVFINLDKNAIYRELGRFGETNFSDEMWTVNRTFEKGLISIDDFLDFYQRQFPKASRKVLINAWNKILLDFPLYRLEFIEEFSSENRCFLLSNTNELHLQEIIDKNGEQFYTRFINCFEKVYLSNEIHMSKPDKEIFRFVLEDASIIPNETFFIDDTKENTKVASQLGIKCWNLIPEKEDIINLADHII